MQITIKKIGYLLLGLSVIGLIITIIIILKPSKGGGGIAPCPHNKQLHTCPGRAPECGEFCRSDQVWDCDKKKCVCKTGKSCENDTVCCPDCENDICCIKDRQITPPGQTKPQCCAPGTAPDKTKTKCNTFCGNSQKPCDDTSECMNISGLSEKAYNDLKKAYEGDASWRGSTPPTAAGKSDGQIFFCREQSTCQFQNPQFLPELVNNTTPFYNFSGAHGTIGTEICFPKDPRSSDPNKCFAITDSNTCNKDGNCHWDDIFTRYSNDETNTAELLKKWITYKGESQSGYYCGDTSTPFARIVTTPEGRGSKCTWQDCLNHISNTGTTQVNWDSTKGRCHALKTIPGTAAGGIQKMVTCTDKANPVPECSKKGDHVPGYIECTGRGSPCDECRAKGQFVKATSCTTQDWQFKPCTAKEGSINTQVLHWVGKNNATASGLNCDGGDCSNCGTNKYCGNCPFGCNDTTNSACYSQLNPLDAKMGNRGGVDSQTGLACDSTGQYNKIGDKYLCSNDGTCEQISVPSSVPATGRLYDNLSDCKGAPCRAKSPGTATAVAGYGDACTLWPWNCCYHCNFEQGQNNCNNGYKPTLTKTRGSDVNCWVGSCGGNCCDAADTNCCDQAKSVAVCAPSTYGPHTW